MAGPGAARHGHWIVPDRIVARALALAAATGARGRPVGLCDPRARGDRSVSFATRAGRRRRAAPARPRQRCSPSAGDDDRRRTRRHVGGSLFARVVARACGAHACTGPRVQGGMAVAAPFGTRSLCAARSGPDRRDRDLHRRRGRALEACRGGVRLAGCCAAGELPRRRLGDTAPLYQQAADRSRRHASRRSRAAGHRRGRAGIRAGWQHARRARDGQAQSRHHRHRRRHAGRREGPGAHGHAGVSVQDRDNGCRDVARRR